MIGRAYMEEVLTQVWLKSIDKQVNAQKESLKNFLGSHKLQQAHEKCAMKMKETKKRRA